MLVDAHVRVRCRQGGQQLGHRAARCPGLPALAIRKEVARGIAVVFTSDSDEKFDWV